MGNIIESSENKGPAYARNLGIKHAGGKYINFLDSDDYFSKTTFRHVLNFYEKNDVDLVSVPIFFLIKADKLILLLFGSPACSPNISSDSLSIFILISIIFCWISFSRVFMEEFLFNFGDFMLEI